MLVVLLYLVIARGFVFFFFSIRRRHTIFALFSWARRCVYVTGYIPVYPYAPPTLEGIKRLTRFKYGIEGNAQSKTDCEKFFGEMPVSELYIIHI